MASVNWQKMTTQAAGALYVHMEKEARKNHNHANENIDKTKTPENYSIGVNSYRDAVKSMKERTKVVDAVQPPERIRRDRVTCCMLEYACPKVIAEAGKEREFFETMHSEMVRLFGAENVHGTFVHKDEVHTYIDGKTKEIKESLVHAHTLVSTYTPEKGINGKAFETRARLKALNKQINEMCIKRFGIEYNTHDYARRKSVEELKAESKIAELEAKIANLTGEIDVLEKQTECKLQEINAAVKIVNSVETEVRNARNPLCSTEIEEGTRGRFSKKEKVVTIPKKLWDDTVKMAANVQGLIQAAQDSRAALSILKDNLSEKTKHRLQREIYELQNINDSLEARFENAERKIELVNATLSRLSLASRAEFLTAFNCELDKSLHVESRDYDDNCLCR